VSPSSTLSNPEEIRVLAPGDCEETSKLMAGVIYNLDYYSRHARQAEVAKYSATRLRQLIEADGHAVLVAIRDSQPVGFCVSTYDDGVIWLAWFGVKESARSQGIGSKLLNAAINGVRERGCHKIWCDSRTSNVESAAVLQRAGFLQICRIDRHWYGQDFFLWEKEV